ncbi:hypothetical protein BO99DRAFT_465846 [Aspergillus violaceofuscus CBS 115571]|uniref:Uncharacterized protein n=1 Tax=Aspergillus violaceofuscus (strain CBS 115571) TaxID=1450538 RepID=A0A2V5ITF5_ASPV1|nr:hypothetical protein BO99DRAFT_465846 [Aspergillus violaceofuscus CBS 115571]
MGLALYPVYWLWNTSIDTQDGFLLYTSCIDIEIIFEVEDSSSTTATLGSQTTSSYAANAPSITGLELVSSDGIIPPSTIPVSRTSNVNPPSSSSQEGETSVDSADTQAGLHNSTLSSARTSTKASSVACTASSSSATARIKTITSTQISGSTRLSVYRAIPSQLGPSLQSGVATRSSSRKSNQDSESTSATATASKQSTTHQASAAPSDTSNPSWEVIVTTICSEISVWNLSVGTSCSQSTHSASLVTHTTTLPYEYVSWVTTTVVVH